jgi:hypothetical protein
MNKPVNLELCIRKMGAVHMAWFGKWHTPQMGHSWYGIAYQTKHSNARTPSSLM